MPDAAYLAMTLIVVVALGCGAPSPPKNVTIASAASAHPSSREQPVSPEQGAPTTSDGTSVKLRDDVVVTGGVHGNEPSGADALEELGALGFRTFGPCNPWGLANHSRFLENGRDLNRSFARRGVPEVEAVKAFLERQRPGLLLDLHEDGNASGAYLIQHGPNDSLGVRIVSALRHDVEFESEPTFQVIKGRDGVLKPGRVALAAVGLSRFYGLAFFAWRTYGITTFVVEVPSSWPAEKRRTTHVRIATTARRLFSEDSRASADK